MKMELIELPINKIIPSAFQPRETFPKDELEELAESMKEYGLLNPILVRKNGDGTYQIIAGERRWRAAQLAGMKKIMAFVKEVTDERQRLESLIENAHRKDLSMIEKGRGMMEIFKVHGVSDKTPKELATIINNIRIRRTAPKIGAIKDKVEEICLKIHIPLRNIINWLESISVDEEVIKKHLETPEEERIADSTLARISSIEEPELQKKTYEKIKKDEMSHPKASKFVTKIKKLPKVKQEIAFSTDIPIEVISEEIEDTEEDMTKKDLEKKYRQKMAQTFLEPDTRLILKDREIPAKSIDEIYVGEIKCPECGEILNLIHCEPGRVHKVQRKPL